MLRELTAELEEEKKPHLEGEKKTHHGRWEVQRCDSREKRITGAGGGGSLVLGEKIEKDRETERKQCVGDCTRETLPPNQ